MASLMDSLLSLHRAKRRLKEAGFCLRPMGRLLFRPRRMSVANLID